MLQMAFLWYVLAAGTVAEVTLLRVKISKKARLVCGAFVLFVVLAAQTALVTILPGIVGLPFMLIGLFRAFNLMRFSYGRMHEAYLYKATARTSLWLIVAQVATAAIAFGCRQARVPVGSALAVLAFLQLVMAAACHLTLKRGLQMSELPPVKPLPEKDMPTLTVAIPARNETEDLADCLRSFIASNYQKLEIIVLDDCSQDRTSDIIKDFAHDGVRFVRGDEPGDAWLAKNAAYDKLAREASGEILLFCGVDVRVEPATLHRLMSVYKSKDVRMMSVLPLRAGNRRSAIIVQQLRYLWELARPHLLLGRPPVLSTMWMIDAATLKKYGGFASVRRMIVPEVYFAKELNKKHQYAFVRSNAEVAVLSTKSASEQRATALRVRYPQLHRKPEVVLAVVASELLLLTAAFPLLAGFLWDAPVASCLAAAALFLHAATLLRLTRAIQPTQRFRHFVLGFLTAPFDAVLVLVSMYKYEFDEVYWKQRNVCLPVMHVVPHLPDLPNPPEV